MRSEILKLIITAVILESIIYIYGTYDPLCSENIHMLFINPVIYGVIPVIIYYFYFIKKEKSNLLNIKYWLIMMQKTKQMQKNLHL